jgi:hypothetical protein
MRVVKQRLAATQRQCLKNAGAGPRTESLPSSCPLQRHFRQRRIFERPSNVPKRLIEAGDFMQVQVGQRIQKRFTPKPAVPLPGAAFA